MRVFCQSIDKYFCEFGRGASLVLLILFLTKVEGIGSEDSKIKILSQPKKLSKPMNTNVTLPCSVLNLDDSVVTWKKDDQVISANNFKVLQNSRIQILEKPGNGVDLFITNLEMEDTGLYKCTVNVNKQDISIVHTLLVEVPPFIQSMNPANGSITVRKGSRVRLQCKAGGQPSPAVYWNRQHNQPFHRHDGVASIKGEELELRNLTREMAGTYICYADNGVSQNPVWQAININILYPPEVNGERTWIHAGKGTDISLACTVYANPPAKVFWYKRTMKLLEGERIHMKTIGDTHKSLSIYLCRLSLVRVKEEDYGDYFCKASNQLEEDVQAKFFVTGRPSTPELSSEQEGLDSYSHELTWQLNSHYSILSHEIVYWESDKAGTAGEVPRQSHTRRVVTDGIDGKYQYTIKGLFNNTFYDAKVRSQNMYGWSPFSPVFTFRTSDAGRVPQEVKYPSETVRPVYQEIDPEPVTSSYTHSRQSVPNIFMAVTSILRLLYSTSV